MDGQQVDFDANFLISQICFLAHRYSEKEIFGEV